MKIVITEQSGPRVLLVGGHVTPNQFSRQLEALGCRVEWHDGKPGKAFPKFCDALVCTKFQLSHDGFWQAKAAYKGKPLFVADHSWSTIKERFEVFVTDWKLTNNKKTNNSMGVAMSKAFIRRDGEDKKPEIYKRLDFNAANRDVSKLPEHMRQWYTPEMKQKIKETVIAHFNAGLGPQEAADQMNKLGLTLADGRKLTSQSVSSWRARMKLMRRGKEIKASPVKTRVEVPAPPPPISAGAHKPDKIVYELILHANLPAVQMKALMMRCMNGTLSQDEALKFIELYSDLDKDGK